MGYKQGAVAPKRTLGIPIFVFQNLSSYNINIGKVWKISVQILFQWDDLKSRENNMGLPRYK